MIATKVASEYPTVCTVSSRAGWGSRSTCTPKSASSSYVCATHPMAAALGMTMARFKDLEKEIDKLISPAKSGASARHPRSGT